MTEIKSLKKLILILAFALLFLFIPVNTMAEQIDEPEETINNAPPLGMPDISEEEEESGENEEAIETEDADDEAQIQLFSMEEEESEQVQTYAAAQYNSISELMLWVSDMMKEALLNTDKSSWYVNASTGKTCIDVSLRSYNISYSQNQDLRFIQYYCPYITGNSITASVKFLKGSDIYTRVIISTDLDYSSVDEDGFKDEIINIIQPVIDAADNGIEYYLSLAASGSTPLEKALILHDQICLNVSYDHNYASEEASGDESFYYANKMLTVNTGVCQAYSYMYMYLMHKLGIECSFVYSEESMNHGWDIIQLNGNWYHVDLTWDDDDENHYAGYVSHNFFLVSDDAIQQYRNSGTHYDYDQEFYAADTSYDNFYWYSRKAKTAIYNYGQYSYYIGEAGFERYDNSSGQYEVIDEITTWDASGTTDYYDYNNSSLAVYNEVIYYAKPRTVWYFDLNTGTYGEYCDIEGYDGYIYGISVYDNSIQFEARTTVKKVSSLGTVVLENVISDPYIMGVNLTALSDGSNRFNYYVRIQQNRNTSGFSLKSGFEDEADSLTEKNLSEYDDCIVSEGSTGYEEGYDTYKLTFDVYPVYNNRNIFIELSSADESKVYGSAYYSVRTYAETVLSLDDPSYDQAKNILKKLLNYGSAAQTYFNYDTSNLSNAGLSDADKQVSAASYDSSRSISINMDGIYYYGSSMLVETTMAMRHYFRLEAGHSISEFTFSVNGTTLTPKRKGNLYYVDIEGLSPLSINSGTVLKITGNKTGASLNYSVMDYAKRINELYPSSLLLGLMNAYIDYAGIFAAS